MIGNSSQVNQCSLPWFEMDIYAQQTVRCCCYYKGDVAAWRYPKQFDMPNTWNHEGFQRLRRICGSRRLPGTGCNGCYGLKNFWDFISSFLTVKDDLTEPQRKNWLRAIEHYQRKDTVIDSYPVRYYLGVGFRCNIRCIMCGQGDARRTEKRELPIALLLSLRKYLSFAYDITLCGGEPLFIAASRKLIDAIARDSSLSNVRVSLLTNGTLLKQYLDRFITMRKLHACVSLDSIGSAYEHVRRGAKWNQVESNMLSFIETARKHGLQWTISAATLVMKSTVARLVELVDWLIKNNISVHFQALDEGSLREEDIFRYPCLLDDLPEWQDIFDQAIMRLDRQGWDGPAKTLIAMKQELLLNRAIMRAQDALKSNRLSEACKEASGILACDPYNPAALLLLARAQLLQGECSRAEKSVMKVLTANPHDQEALNLHRMITVATLESVAAKLLVQTDALIARKEFVLAAKLVKEILAALPRHQGALQRLARIVNYVNQRTRQVAHVF